MLHPNRLDHIDRGHGARHLGQEIVILVLALAGDEWALGEKGSEIPGEDMKVEVDKAAAWLGRRGAEGLDGLGMVKRVLLCCRGLDKAQAVEPCSFGLLFFRTEHEQRSCVAPAVTLSRNSITTSLAHR